MSTRIGIPVEHLAHGYNEALSSPIYATAIGLLMKGIENAPRHQEKAVPATGTATAPLEATDEATVDTEDKWYEQIFRKTKEWFETEPDPDM